MSQKTPGQHIERARLLHNWSQSDLATRLGASRASVQGFFCIIPRNGVLGFT